MCDDCPICLSPLRHSHTLVCGHKFHAECIITHLRRDIRCPVCRKDGNGVVTEPAISVQLETARETPSISMSDAMRTARQSTDPRTKRQFENLRKWSCIYRDCKKTLRLLKEFIDPLDRAIDCHIAQFSASLWKSHKAKYKDVFASFETNRREFVKASRHKRNMRRKIAHDHGYVSE